MLKYGSLGQGWMCAAQLILSSHFAEGFLIGKIVGASQLDGGHALPKFSGKRTVSP